MYVYMQDFKINTDYSTQLQGEITNPGMFFKGPPFCTFYKLTRPGAPHKNEMMKHL